MGTPGRNTRSTQTLWGGGSEPRGSSGILTAVLGHSQVQRIPPSGSYRGRESIWRRWERTRFGVEKQTEGGSSSGEETPWEGKVCFELENPYLRILEGEGME